MKKSSLIVVVIICFTIVNAQQKPAGKTQKPNSIAQPIEYPQGKIFAKMFGEYYYAVQQPEPFPNQKTSSSGNNAFYLYRATLGYQHSLDKDNSATIAIDGWNGIQQAFLTLNDFASIIDMKIGLMPTLTYETVEKIWDYRSLLTSMPLERRGAKEFDMGLSLTMVSHVNPTLYSSVAVYNGTGTIGDNNKLKKFTFSFGNWFGKNSVVEVYTEYENSSIRTSKPMGKVFYGIKSSSYSFGTEILYDPSYIYLDKLCAAFFGWVELEKSLRFVSRVDVEGVNTKFSRYGELFVVGGLDYMPSPDLHVLPNVYAIVFDQSFSSANYLYARLTFSANLR